MVQLADCTIFHSQSATVVAPPPAAPPPPWPALPPSTDLLVVNSVIAAIVTTALKTLNKLEKIIKYKKFTTENIFLTITINCILCV